MKTKLIVLLIALTIIVSFSYAGSLKQNLSECCQQNKECCVDNEACCDAQVKKAKHELADCCKEEAEACCKGKESKVEEKGAEDLAKSVGFTSEKQKLCCSK